MATSIALALSADGYHVDVTSSPAALTEQLVVTAALGEGTARDIHWRAVAQAQAFRSAGGKSLILLQDTGGCYHAGPTQGWHGGMAALARTAALEWPDMKVRCIDIAVNPDDISGTTERLLSALGSTHPAVGVDLHGRLYSLQPGQMLSRPTQQPVPSHASDVWLVSGGARGVTADCIEALAQRVSGRFVLLGRSVPAPWPANIEITNDVRALRQQLAARVIASGKRPVPRDIERAARQALAGQEIRHTMTRLEAAGVSVQYHACDISVQQQVNDVVAKIQSELGKVTALVHGAGVLADSLLVDKTRAQFDRVFETKVCGLQHLLEAVGDSPLKQVALFSSAAAFYGNIGQADYAMANEILNRVAHSLKRRWPDATIKSFNWGPWESGMVDQTLARYFEDRGIQLIPVKEGSTLFADEVLSGDHRHVELLVGDPWNDPSSG
ncbi:MAG: SDR family NAD(P)-dependent oxidoreductase [Granulosicoccus sp.]